jgi:hypothetical protein
LKPSDAIGTMRRAAFQIGRGFPQFDVRVQRCGCVPRHWVSQYFAPSRRRWQGQLRSAR